MQYHNALNPGTSSEHLTHFFPEADFLLELSHYQTQARTLYLPVTTISHEFPVLRSLACRALQLIRESILLHFSPTLLLHLSWVNSRSTSWRHSMNSDRLCR